MTKVAAKIEKIIDTLKGLNIENVFNPYIHNCKVHDHSKSKEIREKNLYTYLFYHLSQSSEMIWVGRDLGYRGGRRTGIPLTDEKQLSTFNDSLEAGKFLKATKTDLTVERTASEVWKLLPHFSSLPFLWNVFPFHPYEEDDPMSNRNHTKQEFAKSKCVLETILEIYDFKYYFALGRDAYAALDEMGLKPIYVRHPSYGGQFEFRKTIIEKTPKTYANFPGAV
jgi:hypothetical protein